MPVTPEYNTHIIFWEDPNRAVLDGHHMTAGADSFTFHHYSLPEALHLQESYAIWKGAQLGDYISVTMLNPSGFTTVQTAGSVDDTQIDVGAWSPYYDPANGATHIEFWNAADNDLLEVHAIDSLSGNNVVFDGTDLSQAMATDINVKPVYGSFTPKRGTKGLEGGFFILSEGWFHLSNPKSITALLPAGFVLSTRLFTSVTAGTRELVCNFIFRTPTPAP